MALILVYVRKIYENPSRFLQALPRLRPAELYVLYRVNCQRIFTENERLQHFEFSEHPVRCEVVAERYFRAALGNFSLSAALKRELNWPHFEILVSDLNFLLKEKYLLGLFGLGESTLELLILKAVLADFDSALRRENCALLQQFWSPGRPRLSHYELEVYAIRSAFSLFKCGARRGQPEIRALHNQKLQSFLELASKYMALQFDEADHKSSGKDMPTPDNLTTMHAELIASLRFLLLSSVRQWEICAELPNSTEFSTRDHTLSTGERFKALSCRTLSSQLQPGFTETSGLIDIKEAVGESTCPTKAEPSVM